MRAPRQAVEGGAPVPARETQATAAAPAVAQLAHVRSRPIRDAGPAATVPNRTHRPLAFASATAREFAEGRANPSACASPTHWRMSVALAPTAAKASASPSPHNPCNAPPQPASISRTCVSSTSATATRIVLAVSARRRVSPQVGPALLPRVLVTRIAARNLVVPARCSLSAAADIASAAGPSATPASPACIRATAASSTPTAPVASTASSEQAGLAASRTALESRPPCCERPLKQGTAITERSGLSRFRAS